MSPSFFEKTFFKIIERKIAQHSDFDLSNQKINEKVVAVYDFVSWKDIILNPSFEKKDVQIKQPYGLCVNLPEEIEIASKFAQFLYIPGALCRQTDILEAAKQTKLPIMLEKGNFLSPNDISRMCEKIKGSDFCLVECGSVNGYSDSILDPRALSIMQNNSKIFGVSLSDLYAPEGKHYSHRPKWLQNFEFISAFIKASLAFQASFFVIKTYGSGQLNAKDILRMVK